jgi:mannosylfructose-phosphate synthase
MFSLHPDRIMMISTHGYVAAEPELGKPDTGGQVVVLELSKCLARMGYEVDVLTRLFEDQPPVEPIAERARIVRFPCGGKAFIPKETLCESLPEWVENAARWIRSEKLTIRSARGNATTWMATLLNWKRSTTFASGFAKKR